MVFFSGKLEGHVIECRGMGNIFDGMRIFMVVCLFLKGVSKCLVLAK